MSSAISFSTLGVNLSGLCDLLGLRSLSSLVIPFRVMSMSSSIGCWFSSVGISEVLENSSHVTSSLLENTDWNCLLRISGNTIFPHCSVKILQHCRSACALRMSKTFSCLSVYFRFVLAWQSTRHTSNKPAACAAVHGALAPDTAGYADSHRSSFRFCSSVVAFLSVVLSPVQSKGIHLLALTVCGGYG